MGGKKYLAVPSIEVIKKFDCQKQVQVWRNAKKYLIPSVRRKLNKGPTLPPKYADTERCIQDIESYWKKLRIDCKNDPDFFKWPTTQASGGNGELNTTDWDELGVLKLFGYSVSQDSKLTPDDRKVLLDDIFETVIPPFTTWSKVLEWGDPKTPTRLKKMSNTMASLTKNARRRSDTGWATAILRWEDDLNYLYHTYYDMKFKFSWPSSSLLY